MGGWRSSGIGSIFLSTLSLRRATGKRALCVQAAGISIHALLAESDAQFSRLCRPPTQFLSTLSLRRATSWQGLPTCADHHFYPRSPCGERPIQRRFRPIGPYFYPRSPCGERQQVLPGSCPWQCISIHALLAESDPATWLCRRARPHFYPRSPCGERPIFFIIFNACCTFLSTLSLRRATDYNKSMLLHLKYFYPRSPCGERPFFLFMVYSMFVYFYPRSPCGERLMDTLILANAMLFLSTLSLRRATPSTHQ